MAKIRRNIGEMVSGKIGSVVFYQLNDRTYVRSAPNRDHAKWTLSQKLYRIRISSISAYWRALRCKHIMDLWNIAAKKMNGFAWFVSKNIHVLNIDGSLSDPSLFQVTDGSAVMSSLTVDNADPSSGLLTVSWVNDPNIAADRLNDELMMISFSNENFTEMVNTNYKRSAQICTIIKPEKDMFFHKGFVYFFFRNINETIFSPSASVTFD